MQSVFQIAFDVIQIQDKNHHDAIIDAFTEYFSRCGAEVCREWLNELARKRFEAGLYYRRKDCRSLIYCWKRNEFDAHRNEWEEVTVTPVE